MVVPLHLLILSSSSNNFSASQLYFSQYDLAGASLGGEKKYLWSPTYQKPRGRGIIEYNDIKKANAGVPSGDAIMVAAHGGHNTIGNGTGGVDMDAEGFLNFMSEHVMQQGTQPSEIWLCVCKNGGDDKPLPADKFNPFATKLKQMIGTSKLYAWNGEPDIGPIPYTIGQMPQTDCFVEVIL